MDGVRDIFPDEDRRDAALVRLGRRVSLDLAERNGRKRGIYYRPRRLTPTPAQLRVIEAISHGVGNRGAAELLGLSPDTVKTHLKQASRLLGAKDRAHLVALALRLRLIQ